MRLFACLLDECGRRIGDAERRSFEVSPRRLGLQLDWQCHGRTAVMIAWDEPYGPALIDSEGSRTIVGVARVDNRLELEPLAGPDTGSLSDLGLILRAITRRGLACIPRILGDFAFVTWDSTDYAAVAVCDAMSVRKIYHARRDGLLAFANRAETLAHGDRYDLQCLAELVAVTEPSAERTVFHGVSAVPAGTMVTFARGRTRSERYWSPEEVLPSSTETLRISDAATTLRGLLLDAVRCRLGDPDSTWSQLSGGLDSSAVACAAQALAASGDARGLDGTVTFVDRQGTTSDERRFSDLVVEHCGLRNEAIVDPPLWLDEHRGVPRLDQPRGNFMHYPREQRLCELVRGNGGRVLLTGQGPDEYLRGSMFFFADWIAEGRIWAAAREMARRAALGRVSFWELAYRNALTPLLPSALRRWFGPEETRLPPWMQQAMVRRLDLRRRGFEMSLYSGRLGEKYHSSLVKGLVGLQRTIGHLVLDDALDVRHPFLDRRLVEFGLRLPPGLIVQPHAGKWLLREAVRDIVPETIRTRVGKGSMSEVYGWSLNRQRRILKPLVERPILAELDLVDAALLRQAYEDAPRQSQRLSDPHASLQNTLAIEAWLQIRADRWPREGLQRRNDQRPRHNGSHEPHSGGIYEKAV